MTRRLKRPPEPPAVVGRRTINVLIVDDSPFIRRAVARILATDPSIRVVGQASTGEEALAMAQQLAVDVVTLDLAMPEMNGIELLERLVARCTTAVVVLSAVAGPGSSLATRALQMGACRVLQKPGGGSAAFLNVAETLLDAVRNAGGLEQARLQHPISAAAGRNLEVVLIGASTGGPTTLQKLIPALPLAFPVPVVVLQHMAPGHTRGLAERLDGASRVAVQEAGDGDLLRAGRVYVVPSGKQLGLQRRSNGVFIHLLDACPMPSQYRPSIDFAFQEAARVFGSQALGVVLTGMGRDGAAGVQALKSAGGLAWAQDRDSSTIYGMPRAAYETGVLDEVLALERIASRLCEQVGL